MGHSEGSQFILHICIVLDCVAQVIDVTPGPFISLSLGF